MMIESWQIMHRLSLKTSDMPQSPREQFPQQPGNKVLYSCTLPSYLISFGWGWHLMNTTEVALAWSLLTKAANDKDKRLLIHSPANIQVITFYQDKWCFPQEIQQQLYQYKKLHQHQVTPPLSQGVPQPACSNEN